MRTGSPQDGAEARGDDGTAGDYSGSSEYVRRLRDLVLATVALERRLVVGHDEGRRGMRRVLRLCPRALLGMLSHVRTVTRSPRLSFSASSRGDRPEQRLRRIDPRTPSPGLGAALLGQKRSRHYIPDKAFFQEWLGRGASTHSRGKSCRAI